MSYHHIRGEELENEFLIHKPSELEHKIVATFNVNAKISGDRYPLDFDILLKEVLRRLSEAGYVTPHGKMDFDCGLCESIPNACKHGYRENPNYDALVNVYEIDKEHFMVSVENKIVPEIESILYNPEEINFKRNTATGERQKEENGRGFFIMQHSADLLTVEYDKEHTRVYHGVKIKK
jgi:anti-sigma regulatory factor (Ser/Thr protein kinase)